MVEEQKVVRVSDWVEVGSPPDETSGLLMERMLREAGILALVRQGICFGNPDSLSAVPGPALAEARRLPEDTTSLGSW